MEFRQDDVISGEDQWTVFRHITPYDIEGRWSVGCADQHYTAGDTCREGLSLALIGRRASGGGSAAPADWPCALSPADSPPGGIWIGFIRLTVEHRQSIVALSVTGSLVLLRCSAAGTQIVSVDLQYFVRIVTRTGACRCHGCRRILNSGQSTIVLCT